MKSQIKILIVFMVLFAMIAPGTAKDPVDIFRDIKFNKVDISQGGLLMHGFINYPTNAELRIVENYYGLDSYGNDKLYASVTIFDGKFKAPKQKVDFIRPADGNGAKYFKIERKVMLKTTPITIIETKWIDLRPLWESKSKQK